MKTVIMILTQHLTVLDSYWIPVNKWSLGKVTCPKSQLLIEKLRLKSRFSDLQSACFFFHTQWVFRLLEDLLRPLRFSFNWLGYDLDNGSLKSIPGRIAYWYLARISPGAHRVLCLTEKYRERSIEPRWLVVLMRLNKKDCKIVIMNT